MSEPTLPPMDGTATPLAGRGVFRVTEYGVASWCPSPDGSGPAEAVVLHLKIDAPGGPIELGLNLRTPEAVNTLVAMLLRHRDDVWPGPRR